MTHRYTRAAFAAFFALSLHARAYAQAPAPTPGAIAAATELVNIMKTDSQAILGFQRNMPVPAGVDSGMVKKMQNVMTEFMKKYIDWKLIHDDFVNAYAELYSEPELRQLISFYKSPVGQKTLELTPQLTQRTMGAMSKQVQAHMNELQQMMMQAMQGSQ